MAAKSPRPNWASMFRQKLKQIARAELHEFNPMLGFRGCRLAIAFPEIAEMQARAIFEAAAGSRPKSTGKPVANLRLWCR